MSGSRQPEPFFFTWSAQAQARGIEITGGRGAWFTTKDGSRWLDLGSMAYQAALGHGHPAMIEAVRAQASRLCVVMPNATYPEKRLLAEKLLAHAGPTFSKVFFTLGGSEAIENAIKIARLATKRTKLVSRTRSYHGATLGALSLTGDWRRPPLEPLLPGVTRVDDWSCEPCPHGLRARTCSHAPLSRIPAELGERDVAAVFVEPVGGANGVLIPPPGYFRALRESCDRHGSLLVADEVLTGFGRTGKWFAFEHFDRVVPDIITVSKALTAGYGTLGAVIVSQQVANEFEDAVLYAGLTQYAHPLGVAAALEAVRIYEEEKLIDRAQRLEGVLGKSLANIATKSAFVRDVRVIGLLGALDVSLEPHQWSKLSSALERRHVSTHVQAKSSCLIVSPPLNIEEADLERGLSLVEEAVVEVARS